ncbi:MAG: hypothetical protein H7202_03095 [Pedobacter sp.]|nr:hypothetical protein [Pedobacter sp.]
MNFNQIANELGMPAKNLSGWKHEYALGKFGNATPISIPKSDVALENIALRKALRDAELERDILKKALGIFSKNDR